MKNWDLFVLLCIYASYAPLWPFQGHIFLCVVVFIVFSRADLIIYKSRHVANFACEIIGIVSMDCISIFTNDRFFSNMEDANLIVKMNKYCKRWWVWRNLWCFLFLFLGDEEGIGWVVIILLFCTIVPKFVAFCKLRRLTYEW